MQALALTDVVVEAAVTALLLAFAIQAHKRFGTVDPEHSDSCAAEGKPGVDHLLALAWPCHC